MMGIFSPMARPRPKETPLRKPVNDPGPVATATLVILFSWAMWRRSAMNAGSRDGLEISDINPFSSIVPATAMVDEVSMTKITLRPDQAAVATEMLYFDQGRGAHLQTVAPFDDNRALLGQLLETQVCQLRQLLDPVQVDVRQLYRTREDAHQLEGWARD